MRNIYQISDKFKIILQDKKIVYRTERNKYKL